MIAPISLASRERQLELFRYARFQKTPPPPPKVSCCCWSCKGSGFTSSPEKSGQSSFCPVCQGAGTFALPENQTVRCQDCDGVGKTKYEEPCRQCNSTGIFNGHKCPTCKGAKEIFKEASCGECCASGRLPRKGVSFPVLPAPVDMNVEVQLARLTERVSQLEKKFEAIAPR